ncbi:hypothetical protein [Helicobacter pullorum]|uniref:hypothetical protein n=1 Tax=Helicobacter pullorum TaxID=35818 RepID=UPI000816995C|nr:hypothetical protein [Helicobacter pullorum]EAI5592841.1 hypothetical protein [Campylobacter jejuni]EAL0721570.1 hypothetical protein [Campylobacter jejuni]OCR08014.1 hypothetical protein A7X13_08175 [Helicobacter pullorum]
MDLEKDILELNIGSLVKESIMEALDNENSFNVGDYSNHCDKETKEYYLGLAHNDEKAKERKHQLIEDFKADEIF